jgi:hypothetical protein
MSVGRNLNMMQLTPHNGQSVTSLMDDILSVRDDLSSDNGIQQAPTVIPGELSSVFALLDPDLAMLHKDMKTAAAQLDTARKTGNMADMALWRFESAQGAYQTRLMEVRKNKLASQSASTAMSEGEIEAKKQMHAQSMQDRMNENFANMRQKKMAEKRRKDEKQGGLFFYLMLGMWLANMNNQKRAQELNMSSIQSAFSNARTA